MNMKVVQSCLTLCNTMDYTVHEILQAGILEWVAFLFSRGSSQPRDGTQVSYTAGGFFTSRATTKAQSRSGSKAGLKTISAGKVGAAGVRQLRS